LRREAKEKFTKFRPANIDQAQRISGITRADIDQVMLKLESGAKKS
jgi:tRNA uridine 5-carboxymethylaminomethyl modification enzyme